MSRGTLMQLRRGSSGLWEAPTKPHRVKVKVDREPVRAIRTRHIDALALAWRDFHNQRCRFDATIETPDFSCYERALDDYRKLRAVLRVGFPAKADRTTRSQLLQSAVDAVARKIRGSHVR